MVAGKWGADRILLHQSRICGHDTAFEVCYERRILLHQSRICGRDTAFEVCYERRMIDMKFDFKKKLMAAVLAGTVAIGAGMGA
jgi:hypothetical protein